MTRNELNEAYFEWMYQLVCYNGQYPKGHSYRKLLKHLHSVDFNYTIPMDGNRAEDGIDLRYRFGYENSYDCRILASYLDDRPCSVLEMMIALAIRCEEDYMDDPNMGNRTGQWFWDMILSLGLNAMTDVKYDKYYVAEVIERFLDRDYSRNGKGGLFTVNANYDMRHVEIWYQMCQYIDERM